MKKYIFSCLFFLLTFFVFGQSQDQNYVRSTTYRTNSTTALPPSPNIEDGIVTISYFDGLGRPIQQIAHKQSATGKDIVTHIEYDSFGRQAKDYLPYPSTQSSMAYIDGVSAASETMSYYSGVYGDYYPFAEKEFEASPLNRVLKQGAPGADWQITTSGTDHTIKFDYQTNNQRNEVKRFKAINGFVSSTGVYTTTLVQDSFYASGQLYKTIITDENGHQTIEYKDKEGRVVMKRAINGLIPHDTYYVYDSYGNLSYVIPPKAADSGTIDGTILSNLCYQYLYDYRNRLIEKKLPGKTWEYIVYDKLDRVVAIGPALSPFNDSSVTGWLITKYDAFGRVVYTGWSTINNATKSTNRNTLQLFMNTTSEINESKQTASNNVNGVILNYTTVVYPALNPHILTVNYYDDYSYPNPPALIPTVVEGEAVTSNLKGLPTGNWVRVLTTPSETLHEMTYSFYDKKARPLRTYQSNHLGGYTQTDVKLDFIGTTLYTVTKHKKTNTDAEITVREDFDYTPEGRLLEHTHKINNLAIETLSHNEYDELGQLIIKRVGKIPSTPLQTVDYKYNIRGWLTDINNVETLGDDLFAFKLSYNDVKNSVWGLVKPLYNGNISETFWKTSTDNQIRKYGYIYDDLNRLDNSIYQKAPTVNAQNSAITSYDSYNEGNVIYDKNGNIIQIRRNGDLDSEEFNIQIDWLFYTYDSGNKLLRVSDGSNHPEGFKDGANTTIEYGYDAFGNMTQDLNKGIPANGISYNHLNLPKQILFSGTPSRKINYLYNALGQKVEKKITNNLTETTTNYQGMFHYENQVLKFIGTSEGYVNVIIMSLGTQKFTNFNYVYNYTDHLGNIRVSYTNNGINAAIIEENHYYPFGLKHKKYGSVDKDLVCVNEDCYEIGIDVVPPQARKSYQYKYNGKEYQDELGLNLYDYGARNYDPAIGRWMNVDPLAELAPGWTPYRYGFNNPIRYTDPTGMYEKDNPVYGSDGTYRGTTNEGFTGEVIIYDGKKDFSNMSADELLYDNFDVNTQRGEGNTYDRVRDGLSGTAKSKIWTHIASQMEGEQIYDENFSISSLSDGKISYSSSDPGSWNSRIKSKTITGTDKYSYETTVENIQSSIIVHEWYSHIKKNQGSSNNLHRRAYENVINFKSLWNSTTDKYKGFNMQRLRDYTELETGQKTVDPIYRNLFNKYSKYSH